MGKGGKKPDKYEGQCDFLNTRVTFLEERYMIHALKQRDRTAVTRWLVATDGVIAFHVSGRVSAPSPHPHAPGRPGGHL